jgi:hypothetical protein
MVVGMIVRKEKKAAGLGDIIIIGLELVGLGSCYRRKPLSIHYILPFFI